MMRSEWTVVRVIIEQRVSRALEEIDSDALSDFVDYQKGLNELCRGECLTGILEQLMGEKAALFKDKVSNRTLFC